MFAATLITLATFASSAYGALFVTAPVASTTWPAGTQQTVSWQDDGTTPTLQAFGPAKVSVNVGNALQQTPVQLLVASVDVSTTSSIVFTPDATVGESGDFYFIRFESLGLKDATQPQFPALAFSAKFTLTGMTGTFNASVQAEIDGQSTAPIGGAATSAPAASTPAAATTTPSASKPASSGSSVSKSSSAPSGSATAKGSAANGAAGLAVSGFAALLGSVVAVGAMIL